MHVHLIIIFDIEKHVFIKTLYKVHAAERFEFSGDVNLIVSERGISR